MFNALIYFPLFSTNTLLYLPEFINRKYFSAQNARYNVAQVYSWNNQAWIKLQKQRRRAKRTVNFRILCFVDRASYYNLC